MLNIFAIVVAVLLIIVIMLQMQGAGLSNSFGGGGEFYRSKQSLDKLLIASTVILAILFGILSIILLIPR
ncbi:MAG: preprotein translocase subunit SecG [Candidatus Levybacteria bacterium RIFCSPHIGHO2_02_FULL_37_10]|uniref:Protein-export membrane protein SecG n=1 Tax=candidate division WWE3 bacterium RIFCSPHIGHO2_01_FULL_35_17 TaxID=1802614 RepID=A0A1F4UPM2_UNCKA|nr:MAG: preprotein translocase subunit SecG [candidate division WWE3 bacterium RIFCSPHIGHO2_01_FULL_35_17]OGH16600.1 MAG: preprotein translocase subunit SecG [Candidatus Levybacteria bacterium RIFCSPHIGHO2_02_FULL_37_10]OGH42258.1 MAG: preprotein translocase subunit SecG [Candidatus Levybacteria bacterium RIFCSPLOWO2_02_FULL_36_8b]